TQRAPVCHRRRACRASGFLGGPNPFRASRNGGSDARLCIGRHRRGWHRLNAWRLLRGFDYRSCRRFQSSFPAAPVEAVSTSSLRPSCWTRPLIDDDLSVDGRGPGVQTVRFVSGQESMSRAVSVVTLVFLALVPAYSWLFDSPYFVTLFLRIIILALAALSLALILSYGGMVSFGHALYLGVGAYSVGILAYHGISNGWIHLAVALGLSAVIAGVTGAICLRTTGLGFIMITFAFAQMFYFLMISLQYYGGDDGLPIVVRSDFRPLVNLDSNVTLYYVAFVLLASVF